jgi:SAM-dependent methyltransferase
MNCPLCNSKSNFFLAGDKREYRDCPVCRLIFVSEKYFIPEKEEVEHYLKHENSLDNEGYVQMFQEKIQVIQDVCQGVQTLLDYGCGYEPVLQTLLTREGYAAKGYDRYFFPDTDLSGTFDLVISTETFEHFKEPGKEVARLATLLKPGGYLGVMTRLVPQKNNLPCLESFDNWYYKRDPTHIAFYSSETFSWIADIFAMDIIFNNEKDFIVLQVKSHKI